MLPMRIRLSKDPIFVKISFSKLERKQYIEVPVRVISEYREM